MPTAFCQNHCDALKTGVEKLFINKLQTQQASGRVKLRLYRGTQRFTLVLETLAMSSKRSDAGALKCCEILQMGQSCFNGSLLVSLVALFCLCVCVFLNAWSR